MANVMLTGARFDAECAAILDKEIVKAALDVRTERLLAMMPFDAVNALWQEEAGDALDRMYHRAMVAFS